MAESAASLLLEMGQFRMPNVSTCQPAEKPVSSLSLCGLFGFCWNPETREPACGVNQASNTHFARGPRSDTQKIKRPTGEQPDQCPEEEPAPPPKPHVNGWTILRSMITSSGNGRSRGTE
ncbi:hypothetical protein FQN50_004619 [Emmonsiellopsis sp. PD_5]|nr:hypothetical protein FQN50_004619 [Emmonsiellopsis sp. PD_5]